MLKILLKKQLTEIFRSYFYNAKTNKARSKGATVGFIVLFVVLMVGVLGGMFTVLSVMLCGPMAAAGMDWFYFALMGLTAILLGAFGSVFNTFSTLYLPKDNDQLLSLPIPVPVLMVSRLLSVYLMGLMYSGIVILPAVIVYWVTVSASAATIVGGVMLVLLISVFVLTLSCLLGWVVAKISLKLRNKSIITVLISLVFLGVYWFVCFRSQDLITDLAQNALEYGAAVKGAAYPVYLFGQVGTGDITAVLIVTAAVLALFAATWLLLSRSFLHVATSGGGASAKKVYREKPVRQKNIASALLGRELSHLTSSPNYMLNCCLGCIFLVAVGVLALVKGADVLPLLEEAFGAQAGSVAVLLCAAVCMAAGMVDTAAPSVSLEGKSLWLAQSLPVTPWQVLSAKLKVQLLLGSVPAAFCVGCIAAAYPMPAVQLLLFAVLTGSFLLFFALIGLTIGLKMPNLTWTNEIMPIKQSGAVMLVLLAGIVYPMLLAAGYLLLPGWRLGCAVYMGVFAAVTLVLCALLYRWLQKKGTVIFASL